MVSRLCKAGCALTLLAGSSAPLAAASVTPQVHAPAQFRIDFTRPGGLPGAPRDIAGARDLGSNDGLVGPATPRHKRRRRTH